MPLDVLDTQQGTVDSVTYCMLFRTVACSYLTSWSSVGTVCVSNTILVFSAVVIMYGLQLLQSITMSLCHLTCHCLNL